MMRYSFDGSVNFVRLLVSSLISIGINVDVGMSWN